MGSTNTQSTGGRGYPRSRCQGQRRRHGPRSGLRSEGCFFSLRGNHEVHVAHSVFTQLGVDTGLFPSPGGLGCSYVQQGRPKRILGQPAHRNHTLPNRKRPPGGRPDERLQEERGEPLLRSFPSVSWNLHSLRRLRTTSPLRRSDHRHRNDHLRRNGGRPNDPRRRSGGLPNDPRSGLPDHCWARLRRPRPTSCGPRRLRPRRLPRTYAACRPGRVSLARSPPRPRRSPPSPG